MHHLEIVEGESKAAEAERMLRGMLDEAYADIAGHDSVDHPPHYTQGGVECIDVLEQLAADGHDFRILNAIKYLWRYRYKGGDESLRKAVWYIERVLSEGQV